MAIQKKKIERADWPEGTLSAEPNRLADLPGQAPVPANEGPRLRALRRYEILDTPPEQTFDDLAELAAQLCDTPIAAISLVDQHRQWFKSKVGMRATQTARADAFCAHTILGTELFIVEDALADRRFVANPLVTAEPRIRFYAGAPLTTAEGFNLGALCVIDHKPRRLGAKQKSALEALARLAISQIGLRRLSVDLAASAANIRTLTGLLPICAYCKGVRNDAGYWQRVEAFIETHTDVQFTHGICPQCIREHFPDAMAAPPELAGIGLDGEGI